MKKIKTTIIITCTQEYYDKYYIKLQAEIASREVKKKFNTASDQKEGVIDVEITLEELPDDTTGEN